MRYIQLVGLLIVVFFGAVVLVELRSFFFVISLVVSGIGSLCIVVFVCTKLSDQIAGSCRRWFVVLDEHRDRRYMRFGVNEIVAVHGKGGLQVVFLPAQSPRSVTTIESEPMKALPSPDFKMPVGDEMLAKINQDDILLGYGEDGTERRATWKQLKAVLILGLSGGGKTSTAVWLIIQMLLQGGRIALVDKHARSEDGSMYERLKPFSSRFDCPVSDCPTSAMRVFAHVRKELDARLDGKICEYPILLVVDEFTAIMRQKGTDEKWAEAAGELAGLIEDLNNEGRKFKMHALCIGQASNASRSGGTEARDTFNTRIMHAMRAPQSRMLSMTEYQDRIAKLTTGNVMVDMEGSDEPFAVRVPYVTDEIIGSVVRRLDQVQNSTERGQDRDCDSTEGEQRRHNAITEDLSESSLQADVRDLEKVQRISELRKIGLGKIAIVEEVWRVRKGGSKEYRLASEEYDKIVNSDTNSISPK